MRSVLLRDYGGEAAAQVAESPAPAAGPAQVLVTIYQSSTAEAGSAPNLQVVRLLESTGRPAAPAPDVQAAPQVIELLAHVQGQGDVGGRLGTWIGERGSRRWVEGFAIAPSGGIPADDIEYQAVLGRGWMSPWVEGGQFCGSRGMALPILGLRVRLRGASAATHECSYSASFVDGTSVGPVAAGEACEAESLSPVEAFSVLIQPLNDEGSGTAPAEPARLRGRPPRNAVPAGAETQDPDAPAADNPPSSARRRR